MNTTNLDDRRPSSLLAACTGACGRGATRLACVLLALLGPSTALPTGVHGQASGAPEAETSEAEAEAQAAPQRPPVALEVIYTGDVFGAVSGGRKRDAAYLDNLDLKLHLDGDGLVGWPGAMLFAYVLSNRGENPSRFVGDAQGVSNIAAPSAWRLYELWLQQNLLDGRMSVLAGLYDLNTEFDVLQSAGLFINSSFGIGPDYSQSGRNGPSIFPVTSLGLRVKVRPARSYYFEAAVLDGVPGDPDDPEATAIELSSDDGALIAAEFALFDRAEDDVQPLTTRVGARNRSRRIGRGQTAARYVGKLAIGGWWYTSKLEELTEVDEPIGSPRRSGSFGLYALAERTLYREPEGTQGVMVFARAGLARSSVNRFSTYLGAGATYSGPIRGRPDDELGLGVAVAVNGDPYRRSRSVSGLETEGTEAVVEFTYRAQLLSWLGIQPDLQWVLNPNTEPGRANALVLGLRAEAAVKFQ